MDDFRYRSLIKQDDKTHIFDTLSHAGIIESMAYNEKENLYKILHKATDYIGLASCQNICQCHHQDSCQCRNYIAYFYRSINVDAISYNKDEIKDIRHFLDTKINNGITRGKTIRFYSSYSKDRREEIKKELPVINTICDIQDDYVARMMTTFHDYDIHHIRLYPYINCHDYNNNTDRVVPTEFFLRYKNDNDSDEETHFHHSHSTDRLFQLMKTLYNNKDDITIPAHVLMCYAKICVLIAKYNDDYINALRYYIWSNN